MIWKFIETKSAEDCKALQVEIIIIIIELK
jgi:hypothetical protein